MNEITLSNRINLKSLSTTTDVPAPVGIKDEITIIKSKIFHPSLKKLVLIFSPKNLINISITKKMVIA